MNIQRYDLKVHFTISVVIIDQTKVNHVFTTLIHNKVVVHNV